MDKRLVTLAESIWAVAAGGWDGRKTAPARLAKALLVVALVAGIGAGAAACAGPKATPPEESTAAPQPPPSTEKATASWTATAARTLEPPATRTAEPTSTPAVPPASPTPTVMVDKIAFVSERDGAREIYLMDRDGANVIQLTKGAEVGEGHLAWSPDGKHILFVSERDGDKEIYAVNTDRSALKQLTNNDNYDNWPAWSPDGTRIVYYSAGAGISGELFLMKADGSDRQRLTYEGNVSSPAWSPDGARILYSARGLDGSSDIYTILPDGSGQTQLTKAERANDYAPVWSPDGMKIAFLSNRNKRLDIYTIQADGSQETRLTTDTPVDDKPFVWSPDGQKIAFSSGRDFQPAISVINADGSEVRQIAEGLDPQWSADGTRILFNAPDGHGHRWIFSSRADGTDQVQLTHDKEQDSWAVWQPSGVPLIKAVALPTEAPAKDQIAFASKRDGSWALYLMGSDGRGLRQLAGKMNLAPVPIWSPDGQKIAFTANWEGNWDIYTINPDGSGLERLTVSAEDDKDPAWSPNGEWLAYVTRGKIQVVQVSDGKLIKEVTGSIEGRPNKDALFLDLAWSPDGQWLTFASEYMVGSGFFQVYGINLYRIDEKEIRLFDVRRPQSKSVYPSWSPDRTYMVFSGTSGLGSKYDLYTASLASKVVWQRITRHEALMPIQAGWSSDGKWITYAVIQEGDWEIYRIRADGSQQQQLTETPGGKGNTITGTGNWAPAWSPNDDQIAFVTHRDGNNEIYVMNPDGSNQVNLTNNSADDQNPAWRP